ncbi:probable cytochrome P450 49a1 [Haliotis rufescens]|uniref:probable cytochrome P450 49a1 n=1 Tax=Haliotis rufescens TaxID=6454 RepID=UPI001EB027B8|nr:probable cytochrome P450 49a1 [Haliotis rufescens]
MTSLLSRCLLTRKAVVTKSNVDAVCLRLSSTAPMPTETRNPSTVNARPFKEMPGPAGLYSLPVLGPLLQFHPFTDYKLETAHKLFDSLHDQHGRTFRVMLNGWTVVTADPVGIEDVYLNEGQLPSRPDLTVYIHYCEKNEKEKGMGVVNGMDWRRLRTALSRQLMRPASPHQYLPPQNAVADDLIYRMKTHTYSPEEYREELFKFAAESIAVVAFNKRLGFLSDDLSTVSPENDEYLQQVKKFFSCLGKDGSNPPFYKIFPTKYYRDFEHAANVGYSYGRKEVKLALKTMEAQKKEGTFDPEAPNLILTLLSNPKISMGDITALLQDILVAGTDSTAKNMECFLFHLGCNRDVQRRLYEEVVEVVGHAQSGRPLEAGQMETMPYYRACQTESFRKLYPVMLGSPRIMPRDSVIAGFHVPKGTCVLCNNRRLMMDEEYFQDPARYDPDRWRRDEHRKYISNIPKFANLPFGFGVRNCLGRRFALQEIWLGVVKIIQNFEVIVEDEDAGTDIEYHTFIQPAKPIRFNFKPR